MKKEMAVPIFLFLILILLVAPVSAGWFGDFWDKITGKALAACINICPYNGATQCYGATGYQTCSDYNADSCLEWSPITACSSDQICINGKCVQNLTIPRVNLISPINQTFNVNQLISFTCSVSNDNRLSKVEFWLAGGGKGFYINETKSISGTAANVTFIKTFNILGNYAWNCKSIDTSGNYDWGYVNGLSPGFKIINKTICLDTDGGKDYYTKGSLTEGANSCDSGICYDSCYNGQRFTLDSGFAVSEWYCDNGIANYEVIDCSNGCVDGACIKEITKPNVILISPINQTFNVNQLISFTCSVSDDVELSQVEFWLTDVKGGFYVDETKMVTGKNATLTFIKSFSVATDYAWNCKAIDTSGNYDWGYVNGLSPGFRIINEPTCFDSDEGKNYYVKGNLTGGNNNCVSGICYDSCYNGQIFTSDSGFAVSEWYCDNDRAHYEIMDCLNGCVDSACLPLNVSLFLKLNKNVFEPGEFIKLI